MNQRAIIEQERVNRERASKRRRLLHDEVRTSSSKPNFQTSEKILDNNASVFALNSTTDAAIDTDNDGVSIGRSYDPNIMSTQPNAENTAEKHPASSILTKAKFAFDAGEFSTATGKKLRNMKRRLRKKFACLHIAKQSCSTQLELQKTRFNKAQIFLREKRIDELHYQKFLARKCCDKQMEQYNMIKELEEELRGIPKDISSHDDWDKRDGVLKVFSALFDELKQLTDSLCELEVTQG